MEKKEVEIDNPVAVAGVTLIPVAKVSLNCQLSNGLISFLGLKQPIGVVVVSPSTKRALDINGEELPLDQLVAGVPGMKEILEELQL